MESPLDPGSILTLPTIKQPTVSPDGTSVAFFWDLGGISHLFTYNLENEQLDQTTTSELSPSVLVWNPNSDMLYVGTTDRDPSGIYAIGLDGFERLIVEEQTKPTIWGCHPDGDTILYSVDNGLYRSEASSDTREKTHVYDQLTVQQSEVLRSGGYDPTGSHIALNGQTDDGERGAFVASLPDEELEKIDDDEGNVASAWRWSPSGHRLLIHGSRNGSFQTGVYDLFDSTLQWLGDDGNHETRLGFLDDHSVIVLRRVTESNRNRNIPVLYRITPTGESFTKSEITATTLSIDGSVPTNFRSAGPITVTNESFVYLKESESRPVELLQYDLEEESHQLVTPVRHSTNGTEFVKPKQVTYSTDEGQIDANLYDSGERPSPAVVFLYGASPGISVRFDYRIQFLVNRGYTVLEPDNHGPPFSDEEADDFAAAGRWLQEINWIDSDCMAVFGHSHGGYNVYQQLVHYPTLWKAGIVHNGMADLRIQAETGIVLGYLRSGLGDPDENPDIWRDKSPITHFDKIDRSLFILHGREDNLVPISQARSAREKLQEIGLVEGEDFRYRELIQGHGPETAQERLDTWQPIHGFLSEEL